MKKILITGGTGSFGEKFLTNFSNKKNYEISIYSRDEMKQWHLKNETFKNTKNFKYILGDIKDKDRLDHALNGIDNIVHAAALKIVTTAEENPIECIKTNIIGASNIIDLSIKNNIKKVIALSTDKACNPTNLYGATKLASDKLFTSVNTFSKSKTKFSVVRYGNVVNSRGSLIPFFNELKKQNSSHFPITDKNMNRFLIELKDAVNFVIKSMEIMDGGEIFDKKLPSVNILDIAKVIDPSKKIRFIGIRPGEKINEIMISEDDSRNTLEYSDHYRIIPQLKFNIYKKKMGGKKVSNNFQYRSDNNPEWIDNLKLKRIIDKYL